MQLQHYHTLRAVAAMSKRVSTRFKTFVGPLADRQTRLRAAGARKGWDGSSRTRLALGLRLVAQASSLLWSLDIPRPRSERGGLFFFRPQRPPPCFGKSQVSVRWRV